MIAAIVFDFDGVLVDSNAIKRNAFFEIFADTPGGAPAIEEVLRTDEELDRFGVIERVLDRLGLSGDADSIAAAAARYNEICEAGAGSCPEIRGATPTLRTLAETYPLFVNSATPEEPLRRIVARRGWNGLFRRVLGRPRTKNENLRVVLHLVGADAQRLLFVGDGPHDLAAATAVGCPFVGVRDDEGIFGTGGARIVQDLTTLPQLVAELEASAC